MRADDGLACEEIATALGISVASAKVKVHRSRVKRSRQGAAARPPGPRLIAKVFQVDPPADIRDVVRVPVDEEGREIEAQPA